MQDVICEKYGKQPPDGFAAKCRYFIITDNPQTEAQDRCPECHRFEEDDTGKWCLFSVDDQWITYKKTQQEGFQCPLNR